MSKQSFEVNATASITANGNRQGTGMIAWTAPTLPEGVSQWDTVVITGKWEWNGKGSINTVTINGNATSELTTFTISLSRNVTSPLSITCNGNRNATGNSFVWNDLKITFTCTLPNGEQFKVKVDGQWKNVSKVFKKESGQWIEQTDLQSVFDTNTNYLKS